MHEPWSVSSLWAESADTRSPPWYCQLVHAGKVDDAVVMDLVALDDCPSDSLDCPQHTPFTLHIGAGALLDRRWQRTIQTWTDTADLVTIVCGVTTDGTSWMCLTSADRHLVLQL